MNLNLKSKKPAHLKLKFNRLKIPTNPSSRTRAREVYAVARGEIPQKSVVYQMQLRSLIQNASKS